VAQLNPESILYPENLFQAIDNAIKAQDKELGLQALALLEEEGITSEHYRTAKILMIEHGFLSYDEGDYK
jgi:hypothetical protein